MARQVEPIEHPADIGLQAEADSLHELLEGLAEAMADEVCPREQVEPRQSRSVQVRAEDVEALLVDFLSEVLWAMQTDGFMVAGVRVTEAGENAVQAELAGEPYDADRHELSVEIKAVTYHQLEVARQAGGGWRGRVIFDI